MFSVRSIRAHSCATLASVTIELRWFVKIVSPCLLSPLVLLAKLNRSSARRSTGSVSPRSITAILAGTFQLGRAQLIKLAQSRVLSVAAQHLWHQPHKSHNLIAGNNFKPSGLTSSNSSRNRNERQKRITFKDRSHYLLINMTDLINTIHMWALWPINSIKYKSCF